MPLHPVSRFHPGTFHELFTYLFILFIYLFIFLLFGDESLIIFINEKNILYKKKLMKMVLGFLSYHFNQFFV